MILISTIKNCPSEINYGESLTVEWQPADSTVEHEIKIKVGDINYTTFFEPGITSHTVQIIGELGKDVASLPASPSSSVSTIIVELITYNDGSSIENTDSRTVKVNLIEHEETKPLITNFEVKPVYAEDFPEELSNLFISGYVYPEFTISGTLGFGSIVNDWYITEKNELLPDSTFSYDGSEESSSQIGERIYKSGIYTYATQLENERNFLSDTHECEISVLSYYSPIIEDFFVVRGGNSSGTTMTATFICNYTLKDEGNTASAIIEYKKGFDEWRQCYTYGSVINGQNQAVISIDGGFDEFVSYNFRITVTDLVGESDSTTFYVPSVKVFLHFPESEKGFGVGRRAQDGHFEVGFESDFHAMANFKYDVNVDGLIKGEHFGRDIYAGKNNCIMDTGNLTDDFKVRIYLIKPFNFVYFRMYVNGLATKYDASLDSYILCHLRGEFSPAYWTPFAVSGGRNCDVLIDTNGRLQLKAWDDVPTTARIYISGFYPLSSDSPLYIQNASRTKTL